MTRLQDALTATKDMAEIGATGSSSVDGPSPIVLPSQYLKNVQDWMFGDSDTANTVKHESLPWLFLPRRFLMSFFKLRMRRISVVSYMSRSLFKNADP